MFLEGFSKLQQDLGVFWNVKKPISWSWVLTRVVKIIENYPSGVTKTIVLSELYQEFLRTGGKISLLDDVASLQGGSVAAIHEYHSVGYDTVLEVVCSRLWTLPGTTTSVISLRDPSHGDGREGHQIEMYLHRKFHNYTEILLTHTLRLTCCRLQPTPHTGKRSQPLWLLPSEHLIILLQPDEESQMMARFAPLDEVRMSDYVLPCYTTDIFAKIGEVGTEEVVHSPDGTAFRRLVVTLSSGVSSVQLVLWDHHTHLARLWSKGDLLFVERPYAKLVASQTREDGRRGEWCLEIGPASLLYLSPFTQEEEILPSQTLNIPVHVKTLDKGRLDFSSYSHRLMVADLVPRMSHGVLLAWCDQLELGVSGAGSIVLSSTTAGECTSRIVELQYRASVTEEGTVIQRHHLHIRDSSGSIVCDVHSTNQSVFNKVHPQQWVLLTGLSSHKRSDSDSLFLICDTTLDGTLHSVSSLVGWLRSPYFLSHTTLGAAFSSSTDHFTTRALLTGWQVPGGREGNGSNGSTGWAKRIHSLCGDEVIHTDKQTVCTFCKCNIESWKWQYNLQCTLRDCPATGLAGHIMGGYRDSDIQANMTPTAAKMLLQIPITDFTTLSQSQQSDILHAHCNKSLLLCISRSIKDGNQQMYQINALCLATCT